MNWIIVTAECGHECDVEVPAECADCEDMYEQEGILCTAHSENMDIEECDRCYRNNHPSLTAYERNR